ncbi:MAG: hypothetical protein WBN22_01520 [Verrucomicrobiia bacterium]
MTFILANHKDLAGRFAACAAGRVLLQTRSAVVKRAVAQKVLLCSRWLETRLVAKSPARSGFKPKLMNTSNLKRHEVLRGKTLRRENSTTTNLTTKGRNQRQVNE